MNDISKYLSRGWCGLWTQNNAWTASMNSETSENPLKLQVIISFRGSWFPVSVVLFVDLSYPKSHIQHQRSCHLLLPITKQWDSAGDQLPPRHPLSDGSLWSSLTAWRLIVSPIHCIWNKGPTNKWLRHSVISGACWVDECQPILWTNYCHASASCQIFRSCCPTSCTSMLKQALVAW